MKGPPLLQVRPLQADGPLVGGVQSGSGRQGRDCEVQLQQGQQGARCELRHQGCTNLSPIQRRDTGKAEIIPACLQLELAGQDAGTQSQLACSIEGKASIAGGYDDRSQNGRAEEACTGAHLKIAQASWLLRSMQLEDCRSFG